jgi:hypothetical protein
MKATLAILATTLFLAGCVTSGETLHGPDRICTDPLGTVECRYGGDSFGDVGEAEGDNDE